MRDVGSRLARTAEQAIRQMSEQVETGPDLVTESPELPQVIRSQPAAVQERLLAIAQDMAAFYGRPGHETMTTRQGTQWAVETIAQALRAGRRELLVTPRPDLTDPDPSETVPYRTYRLPAASEAWDCDELGHVATMESANCIQCGTPMAGGPLTFEEAVAEAVRWDDPEREPEPEDPVGWLERDLDQVAAGQDAASIKARLEAMEGYLAEVAPGDRPENHWADTHPDPYGLAVSWPGGSDPAELVQVVLEGGADHYARPPELDIRPGDRVTITEGGAEVGRFTVLETETEAIGNGGTIRLSGGGRVFVGPADADLAATGLDTTELTHLIQEVRFPVEGVTEVRCQTCQAEVERIRFYREDDDQREAMYPFPATRYVVGRQPTMILDPCGHRDGFTWRGPDGT